MFNSVVIKGVNFQLLNWDFCEDGSMGGIYFLVPKGVYKYIEGGNNGAYVRPDERYKGYDLARAACPCFEVFDHTEEEFMDIKLKYIVQAAAWFIDFNIPRNLGYSSGKR
jgi:hypothetical protein